MGTIAITGSAGGIGRATRARLEKDGHRVIGVDVADAEVIADLSTPAGRQQMVDEVTAACGGSLDGVVAGAGIGNQPGELVVAVNYFGAVATLAGLRPLLRPGSGAVAISSNSVTTQSGYPVALAEACLAGDEPAAQQLAAADTQGLTTYPATKLGLARWVRRQAVTPEWIGAGVRLNAIAPGFTATPMTAGMEEFIFNLGDLFPIPIGRAGTPDEIGALIAFLLGPDAGFFCGSFITVDGGTEAALRAEQWPSAPN